MDDNDNTAPLVEKVEQYSSLEEIIEECVGDFGWIQFLQVVLVSLVWMFDSQQTFISIFTDAEPSWHCLPGYSCASNTCFLPENSWSWDMPRRASVVSEWSLECASSLVTGLPTSSFYLGTLVGGFLLVSLADSSFGRKNTMVLSCIVMSVSGLLSALSTNIWMYSVLRFVSGFGKAMMGTCSLVLVSELVGRKWRGQTGTIGFFFFTVGFLSLPGIAYMNRGSSWRVMYLWTCTPGLVYCLLVYLFVHESPRWLFIHGHKEEFLRTLRLIGPKKKGDALTLASISSKWKGVQIAMELVSFFSACTAFDVLLIYTLELFPTCIRNSGVTIVRQVIVAGGAASPVLVGRGKGLVSYLVFGLAIGICGVFVMWLPETRGEISCDTLDEEETKESRRASRVPDNVLA
ncbi:hypothetical protein ACET3Z_009831 [Daucus carota]